MKNLKYFYYILFQFFGLFTISYGQMFEFEKDLENIGINLNLDYTGDLFSNTGSQNLNKSAYLDNILLNLDYNPEVAFGLENSSFHISVLGNNGGFPSEFCGAVQGISNIEAYNTLKLYECWFDQSLFSNKVSVLFGLYDLNSEFDTRESSSLFVNPSHGMGPELAFSGENGPSTFPVTSLTVRLKYNFSNSINFKTAVLDGVPGDVNNPDGTKVILGKNDGVIISSELCYENESDKQKDYFKYSIGGWLYTSKFENYYNLDELGNPIFENGNSGIYISAERLFYNENMIDDQGLVGFIRLGMSNKNFNLINQYFGAGINYTGIIPSRNEDNFGFALAAANISERIFLNDSFNSNIDPENKTEYIFELTYELKVNSYISFQPDLQYIINPACSLKDNSIMMGLRGHVIL